MEGSGEASVLDAGRIARELHGTRFAKVDLRTATGSTNDDALAVLGTPGGLGLTICAEYQTHGAGRKEGRRWIAPPGCSLLMTTILPGAIPAPLLWAVPFWAGICAFDAIERELGHAPVLRWPNDVMLEGRKCAGILCVSRVSGNSAHVACGIGINVVRPAQFAELAPVQPAFLSDVRPSIEREAVLVTLLRTYDRYLPLLGKPHELVVAWELRAHLAGATYHLVIDETREELTAQALRLGPDGTLIVRDGNGERIITLADATVI